MKDTPENQVKEAVKKYLTTRNDTVLVSNPSGKAWVGEPSYPKPGTVILRYPRRIDFGCFAPGAPDMIGFQTITITQDMVGQQIAQFVAFEIKREEGGRITLDQANVMEMLRSRGAKASIISNVEQVQEALEG